MYNLLFISLNSVHILLFSIVLLTCILCLRSLLNYIRLYKFGNKFNGPKAWPIIGNGFEFLGKVEDFSLKLMNMIRIWPSPFRIWLGPKLLIIIKEPNYAESVFTKNLEKGELYKFLKPWIGDGLITASENKWKKNRKLVLPTFHQQILDTFVEVFQEESTVLVEKIKKQLNKDYFNVFPYLSACTLDIICKTALGVKVDAQEGNSKYCQCANRILNILSQRVFKFWYHSDVIFNLSSIGKKHKKYVKVIHDFVDNVIKKKREEHQKLKTDGHVQQNDQNDSFKMKRRPFLELLIDSTNLTDEEIRDEVNTMTIAGNETTATTISFCLMLLGSHPKIQNAVYDEIYKIFGIADRQVEISDLSKLEYLEMVIKETLRLFPVIPLINRKVKNDFHLGPHMVPSGCEISLGIFQLHRDPKIWTDPEVFRPERFKPEEISKRHQYSFVPFGVPPRNCIGVKFSYMSMKVILANILRNYKIVANKTVADINVRIDVTLKSTDGFLIKLVSRD